MNTLTTIRLVHTVVWAFFVACILAIAVFSATSRFAVAAAFAAVVACEVAVLVLNGMKCPLTAIAARHTADRRANFDIFLPEWLARWNKAIFGTLYAAFVLFLALRWLASRW